MSLFYLRQLPQRGYFSLRLLFTSFVLFIVLFCGKAFSQETGSISGKITDKSNNEVLIGANVLVIGTTTGASTDIDGFEIKGLAAGIYKLRFSYISYQTLII